MGYASLGGVPFSIDPTSVSWSSTMKTAQEQTEGGLVVQVYGVELGDMSVTGVFGAGDAGRGDTAGWQAQERFRRQVQAWTEQATRSSGGSPLRFLFPSMGWDFQVLIKGFSAPDGYSVHHSELIINPPFTLTFFIVVDSTQQLVKGIKDAYLARLMNGVGWKQTQYNGPTADQVSTTLGGQSVTSYVESQLTQAAGGNSDAGQQQTGATSGSGGGGNPPSGNVATWINTALSVLNMPATAELVSDLNTIIMHESSGIPDKENPSGASGLMQAKPGTFAEYAIAPYNKDIFDPVSNIIACVRYADSRYGAIHNVPGLIALRAGRPYVGY